MPQTKNTVINVPVPASVAAGAGVDVTGIDMTKAVLQLQVSGVATVQFQGSLDNTNWYNIGAALSAQGVVNTGGLATQYVRANTTAYTSGTPAAAVAGPPLTP